VQIHRCAVEMKRQDFFEGRWQPYLDRAAVIQPNYSGRLDGGKVGPDAATRQSPTSSFAGLSSPHVRAVFAFSKHKARSVAQSYKSARICMNSVFAKRNLSERSLNVPLILVRRLWSPTRLLPQKLLLAVAGWCRVYLPGSVHSFRVPTSRTRSACPLRHSGVPVETPGFGPAGERGLTPLVSPAGSGAPVARCGPRPTGHPPQGELRPPPRHHSLHLCFTGGPPLADRHTGPGTVAHATPAVYPPPSSPGRAPLR
jgi:hypothetical protein